MASKRGMRRLTVCIFLVLIFLVCFIRMFGSLSSKSVIEKVMPGIVAETFQSELIDHRQPLNIKFDSNRPITINIVMCGMGFDFTGGPLSIMHFANEMIKNGLQIRWINRVGNGISISAMRLHLKKYNNLDSFRDHAEFVFGNDPINCNPNDIFMATIFFTAQTIAATLANEPFLQRNFIYFIQDYEPIFYQKGSNYMEALESYRFPHFAIYSTNFLANFFIHRCIGQCEFGMLQKHLYFSAEPAIKKWPPLNVTIIEDPLRRKKIVVYARKHSDRNAFDLTLMALSRAICDKVFSQKWDFIGVGAVSDTTLFLGHECGLQVPFNIYKNIPEPDYLNLIHTADIGYGLMISPHPSLPPLDFAAAGLISVTNSFATKTQLDFDHISSNFVITLPYVPDIVNGLRRAVSLSSDSNFRTLGIDNFKWENKWNGDRCYGQPLYKMVEMWMGKHHALWPVPSL